jgi:hypothetical protein
MSAATIPGDLHAPAGELFDVRAEERASADSEDGTEDPDRGSAGAFVAGHGLAVVNELPVPHLPAGVPRIRQDRGDRAQCPHRGVHRTHPSQPIIRRCFSAGPQHRLHEVRANGSFVSEQDGSSTRQGTASRWRLAA